MSFVTPVVEHWLELFTDALFIFVRLCGVRYMIEDHPVSEWWYPLPQIHGLCFPISSKIIFYVHHSANRVVHTTHIVSVDHYYYPNYVGSSCYGLKPLTVTKNMKYFKIFCSKSSVFPFITAYKLHDFDIEVFSQNPMKCARASSSLCFTIRGAMPPGQSTIMCDEPTRGRFLRIKKRKIRNNSDVLTLCEVEIYTSEGNGMLWIML